eukprot:CAMPEP_0201905878 /NCGR_PEP_ID=MMETSP0902-20130614/56732_1 /ASSEMBLY_ACC=CAM_ASM_000551 /TAXON_ID=420261 /ORGANISM="Thalassiosira antarctica, Strain CCMP982" /LENGTH=512 /DNA_ID=CAMNT_0048440001 /DNA_START=63 /DNA_END=1601 /DNA_ORIENTATION=+
MKICAACCQELPQDKFSKKQWQFKQQRRCKECIDVNREVQQKNAMPTNESTEVQDRQSPCANAECWICLGGGPDESGQPLRRDCSCRGQSAGFAHISCLVDYAEQKNEQWDGHDPNKFREPWEFCANCHQGYQNDLAVDLASKFVTFVERKYPDKQCPLHLEALVLKLETLRNMASRLQPKQKQEVKKIASNVLFMAEKMKKKYSSLPKRIILAEAVTYSILGRFIFLEGTEESFKAAVVCFEKCRDANEAIGNTSGITLAETYLAYAKSKCEGGSQVSIETVLEKLQQVYEHRVEIFGENAPWTLSAGVDFALTLEKANRLLEAERLLTKLAVISKRVHGPDHQLTKKAASHLELWTKRYVMVSCQHQWFLFQALRYEEDGKECVVKGPIATPRNIQDETSFTVATEDIRPTMDSPVICHGLESSPHLNGKVGDVRSQDKDTGLYRIHFEDKDLEPCLVNHGNMRILFELPVEMREEVVLPPVEAPLTLPGKDEAATKAMSRKGQVTIYHE